MKRVVIPIFRNSGKTHANIYWRFFNNFLKKELKLKVIWKEKGRRSLVATLPLTREEFVLGLAERDLDPIQKWCEDHNCGVRTSFDTFRFKNQKEKTMFLLKWGNYQISN